LRQDFRWTKVLLLVCLLLLAGTAVHAQMLNPAIDRPGQPFSYIWPSTDQMTIRGAQLGTEITTEGYLYTGWGELMFLVGNPPQPVSQRIRTLERGYLPIFHYQYADGTVRYDVTTFAAPLGGSGSADQLVNFIRVVATNSGKVERTSYFNVAFRYNGPVDNPDGAGDHRFPRPVVLGKPGDYSQAGVNFDPNWTYGFADDLATRSGKVVYEFPASFRPVLWLTRSELYSHARKIDVLPDTPVLLTQFELHLASGASQALIFKMPVQPIAADGQAGVQALRAATFDSAFQRTVDYWQQTLDKGMQIQLPEAKVADTFRASLVYDLEAIDHRGEDYIQTVNKVQYHAFWLRDGSHIMNAYDETGHFDAARQCLPFFLKTQNADGLFLSQPGQYDGWGQALWAFGRYYELSHDRAFATQVYPAVKRAVAWLHQAREADPMHLMPAANPHDDEFTQKTAHVTGHNFWALVGLRSAIELAKAVGTPEDAAEFQREYDDYSQRLFAALRAVAAKNGGYIPAGIDVPGGQDWGNMNTLYPEVLLPPSDPLVTGTLEHTRAEYAEGLMTYASLLHHYITMKNSEAEIVRDDQQQVVGDLYAILLHTSSTQAGWEYGVAPWGTRDFGVDLAPHGWFAADYIALVRNMLVREEGNDLHLLSVLSPAWTKPGATIEIRNAPTRFGIVGFKAIFGTGGMTLDLDSNLRQKPEQIVLHLPWFVTAKSARADGRQISITGSQLQLPPSALRVEVDWVRRAPVPDLSYSRAVEAYEREYRARYEQFLKDGSPRERPTAVQ
jgi:hypothetical protein